MDDKTESILHVAIRVPPELHKKVKVLAAMEGCSIIEVVERMYESFVDKYRGHQK